MKKNLIQALLLVMATMLISFSAVADDWLYSVRKGDTARIIANKYLVNPHRIDQIMQYNQLDLSAPLKAGSVLKFPMSSLKFGPARVQVLAVHGQVSLYRQQNVTALTELSSLVLGDKLVTAVDSSATLQFADKSELLLSPESELHFDVLTRWGITGMVDSRMRLLKGSVEGRVETLSGPGAHFEVHTPSAVATVRGTEFRVRVGKENTEVTFNEVSEGKVNVANNVAQNLVPQGFGLVSEAGKKTKPPIKLLPAPKLQTLQQEFSSKPVRINWQQDPAASKYRYELFQGENVSKQLTSATIKGDKLVIDELDAGDYLLRLRAVDSNGLEGLDTVYAFKLNGAPKAPTQLQTSKPQFWQNENVEFNWQASVDSKAYKLEVASDEEFQTGLQQLDVVEGLQAKLKIVSIGNYFWRLRAVNDFGSGQYSQIKTFEIVTAKGPEVEAPQQVIQGERIDYSWSVIENAEHYYWQFSEDKNFSSVLLEGSSESTSLAIQDLDNIDYYFRVRAVGKDFTTEYSEVKVVSVLEAKDETVAVVSGNLQATPQL